MSRKQTRRKCSCCKNFFVPDYRNSGKQEFCSNPACRKASKALSQRRWAQKETNRDYFRGSQHVDRVKQWRKAHPGYWRKKGSQPQGTQPSEPAPLKSEQRSCNVPGRDLSTLQDLCLTEHPAFVGLISFVTGSTLQDDIAATSRCLLLRGQNILGLNSRIKPEHQNPLRSHDPQTLDPAGSASPGAAQL